ncbi:unnamed protein product [Ectocarpus sp. 12 AP-2014]
MPDLLPALRRPPLKQSPPPYHCTSIFTDKRAPSDGAGLADGYNGGEGGGGGGDASGIKEMEMEPEEGRDNASPAAFKNDAKNDARDVQRAPAVRPENLSISAEMPSPAVGASLFPVEASTFQSSAGRATRRTSFPGKTQGPEFPPIDEESENNRVGPNADGFNITLGTLIEKVPEGLWQANGVVPRHRRKAHLYWGLLVLGYAAYIAYAIRDGFERRKSPPVQLTRINEAFQLPDVGFCFEGDTYGSRFGCFDGDADGEDCADSYIADAFVYGYNRTGYTTPDGYDPSEDYIVLLPDSLSATCRRFRLSTLTANADSNSWHFHMLMFWNSKYNATLNPGAFESIKMYLYDARMTAAELADTPITLYAPMSFDANEVPFVRGFLEYEQRVKLNQDAENNYMVVDTTQSPWHNAEDAVVLAADYGTDSLASIQLDIRTLTYVKYEEVDPMDTIGTIGEISGFWLVVPLLFGLLFYRRQEGNEKHADMRSFTRWGRNRSRAEVQEPRSDFT